MSDAGCDEFRQTSAEMALGIADARARTAAAAHLEHCPRCRLDLRQLSDTADALASLTPAVEPPAGFESRVLDRLDRIDRLDPEVPPARRRPARRRSLWAAAAALVALAAGAAGWAVGDAGPPAPASASGHVVVARLTADRQPVGQVVIQTRRDPWISMGVSIGHVDAVVQCQLRAADGRLLTVGWLTLSGGYGYWAAPLTSAEGVPLVGAQVADPRGRVLASAALPRIEVVHARST